jgi:adenylate cyclase
MSQSRQLAAIMFTDIVGYTALMGNDEHKAFTLLKKSYKINYQKEFLK